MKFNRQKALVLSIALAAAILSAFPLHAAIEYRAPEVLGADPTTYLAVNWSEVWDRFRRKEVPGGSRGNGPSKVCAVVPGALMDKVTEDTTALHIWGLNPVFVWQGEWSQLTVFRSRDHEALLSQDLNPEARHLVYGDMVDAMPLEPGGSYYWHLSRDGSDENPATFGETSFRTLGQEKWLEMETALAEIDASEDALSKRVAFFAEQGLWADVVREVYTADELPSGLVELKANIAGHDFCVRPSDDESSAGPVDMP
ncbi:MAG: hypothetical protein AAGD25_13915 [Cyanobacteria bacterium P01_F01_bin.150]